MTTYSDYHPDVNVKSYPNGWINIQLDRPNALHALDLNLVKALISLFKQIAEDNTVKAIWFDSSTPKAFCAGGDVRKLRQQVIDGEQDKATEFFKQEYQLDLLLHYYAKPIVVWGEGYVMGGGLGLFMAAPFRLVTPASRLAMPEINIGLYPDVGATRFLADRGRIGLFLGLTGTMMTASGAYAIGWATHICAMKKELVFNRLLQIAWQDYPAGTFRALDDVLHSLHRPVSVGPLQTALDAIHTVCNGLSFEQDYDAICQLSEAHSDWLRQAGESLKEGSLVTAALTWLLWQWGKFGHSWADTFELEQQISTWKINHVDFVEGVRARLIDKDLSPKWQTSENRSLKSIFSEQVPITTIESWNDLLRDYDIIERI
ncbi:enoyl-CoA hydratase/isomerase family protein [Acinetobacter rathckeae]|uniref:enoyl-CoA hydratase/isomerase family protein n=1 Tax=Acinetobacter rathckeae TaxID=2605272 RepID=UPI0018A2ADB5|nr:enoyl-CoA hydratase/isomerase family protein [Acinetobacter rathckeae]MBF7695060.1 enoyl-CoA hydratase/isomerase family protein [Acinetobacter rathckeae]